MVNNVDWTPMDPQLGPPLPKFFSIKWPWARPPEVVQEVAAPPVYVPTYAPAPVYEIHYPPAAAPQPITVEIVAPPVTYVPPVYEAPVYELPEYEPPVYEPPIYVPPVYEPPVPEVPKPEVQLYTLTGVASPATGGRVNPHEGDFASGTPVLVTATPYPSYEFDYWGEDASGRIPTVMVRMTRDRSVIAYFKKVEVPTPPITPPVAPFVPEVPKAPTLPTADMFNRPSVNFPSSVEIGKVWSGSIVIPTKVPLPLSGLPGLPSYLVDIKLNLESFSNRLYSVASLKRSFTPGKDISIPVNFNTSHLIEEGMYDLTMRVSDVQGNKLFEDIITKLRAFKPEPPVPPAVPAPPALPAVLPKADIADYDWQKLTIPLDGFKAGDVISWKVTGKYKGRAQNGSLTIALGFGSFAPLITQYTFPPVSVYFKESYGWEPFVFRGNVTLPTTLKKGYTYSVRAKLEAIVEYTQETDHDINIISMVK